MDTYMIFFLIALALILFATLTLISAKKKSDRCSEKTVATITNVRERWDNEEKKTYYTPEYVYTVNGKEQRASSIGGTTDRMKYRIGMQSAIRYNPDKPYEIVVEGETKKSNIGCAIIVYILAIVVLVIGLTQIK